MKALLGFLLAVSSQAYAADWKEVGADDRVAVFIDASSVATVGKYKKAWGQTIFAKEQLSANGKYYKSIRTLLYFSCTERTWTMTQTAFYSVTGTVTNSSNTTLDKAEFVGVIPDTVNEAGYDYVCKR